MAYRLLESSSDIVAQAEGPDAGAALVELARAFTDVTTAGQTPPAPDAHVEVDVDAGGEAANLAVAFVNELVYLFTTRAFLPTGGDLRVAQGRVAGRLHGFEFDPRRHAFGTEVKAATLHEARFAPLPAGGFEARVLLDL